MQLGVLSGVKCQNIESLGCWTERSEGPQVPYPAGTSLTLDYPRAATVRSEGCSDREAELARTEARLRAIGMPDILTPCLCCSGHPRVVGLHTLLFRELACEISLRLYLLQMPRMAPVWYYPWAPVFHINAVVCSNQVPSNFLFLRDEALVQSARRS